MRIEPVNVGGVQALRVSGRLDTASAQAFSEALLPLLAGADAATTLDLSGVEYISSSGLRVLLQAAKLLQTRSARLSLTRVPPSIYSVLTLSGFTTFMTIQPQL